LNLQKVLLVKVYESLPNLIITQVKYINLDSNMLSVQGWTNNHYTLKGSSDDTIFWSFNGSSSAERADWILPVTKGFYKRNYMGMNNSDYGGGIPVTDIWTRNPSE